MVLSSVSRRRAKPAWLPEKKHRVGANGFEGKGACCKKIFRTTRGEGKRRKLRTGRKKALHGEFSLQTSDVSGEESWLEMAQECFVKEGKRRLYPRRTRASFKNNSVKHSINKTPETSLGRLCGDSTETVRHIVSGCSKLAQREYRKHQDKVALQVHYELCRTYRLERTDKKYDHHPVPVAENGELRIINNYSLKSR